MVRKQIKDDFMWCFGTPVRNLQNSCSRHSGKSEFLSDAHGISGSSWVYVTIDKTVRFPISHVDRTNTPALIGHVLSKHLFSKKNRYIIFLDLDLGPSVSPVFLLSPRREPQIDKLFLCGMSCKYTIFLPLCPKNEGQVDQTGRLGDAWDFRLIFDHLGGAAWLNSWAHSDHLIRLQGNRRQPNGCNWLNNHLKIGYCDFGIQYFMGDTLVAHIWTWFERNDLSKSVFVGFISVQPKNLNNSVFMTDAEAVRAPWCSIPFCYSWTGNLTWVQREVTDMGTTVLELSQLLYDVSCFMLFRHATDILQCSLFEVINTKGS